MVGFSRGIVDFGGIEELPGGTEELWAVIFCPPRCSELHSVQWGHLFSGVCKIRYQKGHPTVPNMRAVLKKASCVFP